MIVVDTAHGHTKKVSGDNKIHKKEKKYVLRKQQLCAGEYSNSRSC
jgi:hypothetical protein